FRALGHDPITVCRTVAADGYGEPLVTVSDPASFSDPEFWRALRIDVAVVVTWLGLPAVVAAIKQSCPWVVSIADSDGQIGCPVHRGAMFRRMTAQHRRWTTRARGAHYWLQLYLRGSQEADRPILASAAQADRVVVCSPAAAAHLQTFFDSYRHPELAEKVVA